jgi:hypothetical protein
MKYLGLFSLIIVLLSCVNQNNSLDENKSYTYSNIEFESLLPETNDTIILNPELLIKFDSIKTLYKEYNIGQTKFDTLMLFQINDHDTLIRKSEVKFLKSFDPNAAYYLFGSDTITGGNGECSSDYYLLKNGKLFKVSSFFADCVESSSSTRKEIYFDSTGIRLFYVKVFEDFWDEQKFKQGFGGCEKEIIALFNSKEYQFGIQKSIIKCRSDINLSDTMKIELLKYDDFSYLIPEIKFGFEE